MYLSLCVCSASVLACCTKCCSSHARWGLDVHRGSLDVSFFCVCSASVVAFCTECCSPHARWGLNFGNYWHVCPFILSVLHSMRLVVCACLLYSVSLYSYKHTHTRTRKWLLIATPIYLLKCAKGCSRFSFAHAHTHIHTRTYTHIHTHTHTSGPSGAAPGQHLCPRPPTSSCLPAARLRQETETGRQQ